MELGATNHHLCVGNSRLLAKHLDQFLQENLSNQDLTLLWISRRHGVSADYATRSLKRQFGTSFRDRLKCHRVRRAKQLLLEGSNGLAAVATVCGFRSASRLCEAFRKITGQTPMEWARKRVQLKQPCASTAAPMAGGSGAGPAPSSRWPPIADSAGHDVRCG